MAKKTIILDTDIELLDKYQQLVSKSLDGDSIYIRVKETLNELFKDNVIDNREKGNIIAQVVTALTTSITTSSMNTALQWATHEKDLFLRKEQLEYELEILDKNANKAAIDVELSEEQKKTIQAESLRKYGVATTDSDGNVASLSDTGLLYEQIEGLKQDNINKGLQEPQIKAQTDEVYARTHKVVADTYINHGLFTGYTLTDTGIASATKVSTNYVTLSDLNKEVAKEQAKGYTLNAWSNANTSSASMVGTLIAAEIPNLDPTQYLTSWKNTNDKLGNLVLPSITI